MKATEHGKIFTELTRNVESLGQDLDAFLKSDYFGTNNIREQLDQLTDAFFALSKQEDLTALNHAWIASFTDTVVADSDEFSQRWQAYTQLDAVRTERKQRAERESEENANPLEKLLRGWCTTTKRSFNRLTAIDIDGIHFFADEQKFTAKVDHHGLTILDADDRKLDVIPLPEELRASPDRTESGVPDGEIVNNSFSTNAPHVVLDFNRFIRYDPELGTMVRMIRRFSLVFAVTLIVDITLFATGHWIVGLLLVPVLWFTGRFALMLRMVPMIRKAMTQFYHSALLTPALIEKTNPLTIVCLAAMGNGSGTDYWGLKRLEIASLPLHPLKRGEVFPCVSVFQSGDADDHWDDFTPRPISWGTADTAKLKQLMKKMDASEIEHLKRLTAQGPLPSKTNEILLLDGRFQPVKR
jgi:hypothetical protein